MFNFRCKGINISCSIQIFGQINVVLSNIYVTKKDKNMKNIAILASGEVRMPNGIRYFKGKKRLFGGQHRVLPQE